MFDWFSVWTEGLLLGTTEFQDVDRVGDSINVSMGNTFSPNASTDVFVVDKMSLTLQHPPYHHQRIMC